MLISSPWPELIALCQKLASLAASWGDVPVGAVVVRPRPSIASPGVAPSASSFATLPVISDSYSLKSSVQPSEVSSDFLAATSKMTESSWMVLNDFLKSAGIWPADQMEQVAPTVPTPQVTRTTATSVVSTSTTATTAAAEELFTLVTSEALRVIWADWELCGVGANRREVAPFDPTAHAEVLALRQAAATRNEWRLADATLVVSLEPCVMCAGAAVSARVGRVVFGAWDPKAGAAGSLRDVLRDSRLNHCPEVIGGVNQDQAARQLETFFSARRS